MNLVVGGIKMNRKGRRTVKKGRTLSAFTIIFITGLFLGCSTIPTQPWSSKGYGQRCQSYVGRDVKSLIDAWGYPHRKLTTDDGNVASSLFFPMATTPYNELIFILSRQ